MELTSNAPSCTVKAAVCPYLGRKKNGKIRHPQTGQPLKVKSLKEIVYSQLDIPESREKGTSGCVFAIPYNQMYSVHDTNIDFHSSGAVFVDLDHVNQQEIENINNSFDKFIQFMPDMLGMNLSYSGTGFHLYFLSNPMTPNEYAKWQIGTCVRFNKSYEKIFGVQLPNTIFDAHQTGIKQRFFLNRPSDMRIQWNDSAIIGSSPESSLIEFVNKHIDYYDIKDNNDKSKDSIYTKWHSLIRTYEPTSTINEQEYLLNSSISRKNVKVRHLDHKERMRLYSSLRVAFHDDKDIVANEWEHCMRTMEYLQINDTQLKDALAEPDNNRSWKTYSDPHISREFYLFYNIEPLKDTKCEDKPINVETNKEPALTDDEKLLLAKYM